MSATERLHLTALPAELLHNILQWMFPADLVTLPRVCRMLYEYVRGNQTLFRAVYLNALDTPDKSDIGDHDWIKELRDLARLQSICLASETSIKKDELGFVYQTVTRLLDNATSNGAPITPTSTHSGSRNATILKEFFKPEAVREAFLEQSFLFERLRKEHRYPIRCHDTPRESHQQSAKLHCLYGKAILNVGRLRSKRTYPFACSKVYDLRQYTGLTGWGPFMNDGSWRVDWEKVEAILIVLATNVSSKRLGGKIFADVWDGPFSGSWPRSFLSTSQPVPKADIRDLDARDPYGVTGTWYRIVCFLDYNDFFAYNFTVGDLIPEDAPRPPLNVEEATRMIVMRIHVTSIEPPGPDDGQALPVVHFEGVSQSLDDTWDDNADSGLRGTVRLTKEGEVRWTSFSIFHGQERWRSEGIQIGGPKSARGVVGNWFDRDFDPHGPAGPTAFWKASDNEKARDAIQHVLPSYFFLEYGIHPNMDDSDPEGDMEFLNEDMDEDDDDDEEMEPVASELPGLLLDAEIEVIDMTLHEEGYHNHGDGE